MSCELADSLKEASAHLIELEGDDCRDVERMMAYLDTFHYDVPAEDVTPGPHIRV